MFPERYFLCGNPVQHGDSGWIEDVDLETEFAAALLSRDCGEHGTVERDCLHGPAACIRINIECDFGASAGGAGMSPRETRRGKMPL